jgi:hypothetical protein
MYNRTPRPGPVLPIFGPPNWDELVYFGPKTKKEWKDSCDRKKEGIRVTWIYESGVSNVANPLSRLSKVVFNHCCFEVLEQDKEDTPDFTKLFNRYLMPQQRSPPVYV